MKNQIRNALAACLLLVTGAAHSEIMPSGPSLTAYNLNFSFTGLEGSVTKDFGFNFTFEFDKNFPGGTSFSPITPAQSSAKDSLGYEVAFARQWGQNSWIFDDIVNGTQVFGRGVLYDADAFMFSINAITGPDTSSGMVFGQVGGEMFSGTGTLTLTQLSTDVPEPASLALLGIGALALMRRRTRK